MKCYVQRDWMQVVVWQNLLCQENTTIVTSNANMVTLESQRSTNMHETEQAGGFPHFAHRQQMQLVVVGSYDVEA